MSIMNKYAKLMYIPNKNNNISKSCVHFAHLLI